MSTNTILATAPLTATGYHLKATGTALGQSLIWDNGTNVGIGNQGTTYTLDVSGTLRNTTSAYFATSSGNVGIGTATPSSFSGYKVVSISGTSGGILDLMYNGTSQLRISAENGANYISGVTNAPIYFYTNSALSLTLASSGAATFSENVLLAATKRLYLSGTSFITEITAGTIRLAPAGNDSFDITSSLLNVWVPAVFDSTIKTTAISTNNGIRIADSNVAYTLFTISAYGLYIVYVDLPAGSGTPSDYSSYAIISYDATTARILQQTNGALMFITLSGNNVQGRQTSGGQYNIRYVYQRIAV